MKYFGNTYFSDKGTLKRNKVIEDLDAYTPILMKTLLANPLIHDTYTESIVALMSRLWTGFCVKANVIMVIIAKDFGTISFGVSLTKAEAE
ncbi:hypothetical protein [Weissella confusa]|uniref:hypothetical protein n=1 Tax=Weissella confusa TaxID=1583 RepID=UPI001FD92C75|nr:hypothetical protein [Weissella confusa]